MPSLNEIIADYSRSVQPLVFETGLDQFPYSTSGTVFLVGHKGKAFVVTRNTERQLLDQVDAQLRGAQQPVRGFDPGHRAGDDHSGGGPAQISSVYVGVVDATGQVATSFAPNLN